METIAQGKHNVNVSCYYDHLIIFTMFLYLSWGVWGFMPQCWLNFVQEDLVGGCIVLCCELFCTSVGMQWGLRLHTEGVNTWKTVEPGAVFAILDVLIQSSGMEWVEKVRWRVYREKVLFCSISSSDQTFWWRCNNLKNLHLLKANHIPDTFWVLDPMRWMLPSLFLEIGAWNTSNLPEKVRRNVLKRLVFGAFAKTE